ncbi:hypothetical protein HWI79_203 [Cryptosporidium felis]|nr:hypothetical protein HWI79_203 [Cryptosporidium felis]
MCREPENSCCISNWHRDSNSLSFFDEEPNESKIIFPWNNNTRLQVNGIGCIDQIYESCLVNSGPIGRHKLKSHFETSIQSGQLNVLNIASVSRLLSDWRKDNEIKCDFVMELIDFTKLCGIKKNISYKDLFELLSKIFVSKLKAKKILDNTTYAKFDELALKCVKLINVPHLVELVIMLLSKFNRLSNKVIKELTTPDLYLFPSFISFYKSAPIKLRQQMWLRRPGWFIYEILPFIICFTRIFSKVDCFSILNSLNSSDKPPAIERVKGLFKSILIGSKINEIDFKDDVDKYVTESLKNSCNLKDNKYSQQSDSLDSIFSFASRIQSIYISCVELEHDNIELLGESCKCLAFNFMNSDEFYKSYIQLQINELLLLTNSVNVSIKTNKNSTIDQNPSVGFLNQTITTINTNGKSYDSRRELNASNCNLTICGNILRLGRIIAYISHCIGNYKELYLYFVNILRQIYIDSLFHNIGNQITQCETNVSDQTFTDTYSEYLDDNSLYSNLQFTLQKKSKERKDEILERQSNEPILVENCRKNMDCNNMGVSKSVAPKHMINLQFKQKLNDFSGEPSLSSLRIFVALRIFHFSNKTNRSEEDEKKMDYEKFNLTHTDNNVIKGNLSDLSNNEVPAPLAIFECDSIAWPCIHIVGNILRDGFYSNKSQDYLVNISSTLIIKSKVDLADISFIFSEPHFLYICSEFILETSILAMFHSTMDALLVLNPQRRKIPISLISLGLNSPYLSFNNKDILLGNSTFLMSSSKNTLLKSISNSPINNLQNNNTYSSNRFSPFQNDATITLSTPFNNSGASISKKRCRRGSNEAINSHNYLANNQEINFAIRFDTLLNLMTSFNINNKDRNTEYGNNHGSNILLNDSKSIEPIIKNKYENSFQKTTEDNVSLNLLSVLKLNNTIFTKFLPLIDRYLELSISSRNSNQIVNNREYNKKKTSETLKSIRNELVDYTSSFTLRKQNNFSDSITIKFIRLISTSLFFTGMKPVLNRQEGISGTSLLNFNLVGLSYYHLHHLNSFRRPKSDSQNNQIFAPSLPSCINLSIRLLEMSLSPDWINQIFLKALFGLLYTYPRISSKFNNRIRETFSCEMTGITDLNDRNTSLFTSIPNDIIHGLLFRIILPSIRDPYIGSTYINTIHEIINNYDVYSILDNKTKKLCLERLWVRSPFQFTMNSIKHKCELPSSDDYQKLLMRDLYQFIQNSENDLTIENLKLDVPFKETHWEHHFIQSSDGYLLFVKWALYFIKTCENLDENGQNLNKLLSVVKIIEGGKGPGI